MPVDWLNYSIAKFVLAVTPTAPVGSVLFNICNSCKVHASMKDSAKYECEVLLTFFFYKFNTTFRWATTSAKRHI